MMERFSLDKGSLVVDPFSGSGTTLVCAKSKGVQGIALEANDYFHEAASVKLEWKIDSQEIVAMLEQVSGIYRRRIAKVNLNNAVGTKAKPGFSEYASKYRPDMLDVRYMSDHSFSQVQALSLSLKEIEWPSEKLQRLFGLGLSSILVPCSNVRYGPGFGVTKKVKVVDVFNIFQRKMSRMASDLDGSEVRANRSIKAKVILGDAREMSRYIPSSSVDVMITSPPYPGDHEYTKHSRMELIFGEYAKTLAEFRTIKKRMLRGSTTNVYRDDDEGSTVQNIKSIASVVKEIEARLQADGATSGFEKLYPKLIWEYFGGMYRVFEEASKVLKPGSPFSLLVSDSHAFKMVHIETAKILSEVAMAAGFKSFDIELWQFKNTTSHKYQLFENILTVWN